MQADKARQAGAGARAAVTETAQAEVKAARAIQEVEKIASTPTVAPGEISKITKQIHFSGDEALNHFNKHGEGIGRVLGKEKYNLQDYLDDANHVIQSGRFVPECNAYVKLIGNMEKKISNLRLLD